MKAKTIQLLVLLLFSIGCSPSGIKKIDLSGEWRFAADPKNAGIKENWFSLKLEESVFLPGSMNSNGKGDEVNLQTEWTGGIADSSFFKNPEYEKYRQADNFKIPFWLQPLKHYQGVAWYQKEVNIPAGWEKKQIILFLERCHWESRLWIDDQEIGMQNSLGTPHVYDLSGKLKPGNQVLTLRIDNRVKDIDPGVNSHSISDHTQTNWNGVVGDIFLEARSLVKVQSIQTFPDVQNKKITLKIRILNATKKPVQVELLLQAIGATKPKAQNKELELQTGETMVNLEYPMGNDVKTWDEFNPNIYSLKAIISQKENGTVDSLSTTFGMRSIQVKRGQIEINGRPVFMRGTLECAIFPKTGYPATDVVEWTRIFDVCRTHGLNHMRFHSWCPPEAAFIAADRTGFYLHVECSSWANQSTTLGDGKPFDKYLYEESQRIVLAYGNHPSFCFMAYGNEPGGYKQVPFLTDFVNFWKSKDSRRIYTAGAGWPVIPENDFISSYAPRIQGWGQGLNSIINAEAPRSDYDWSGIISKYPQPVISHEIGQWCVYPNFKEMDKYDGVLGARNFEIFRETLEEHGMEHLADSFLLASGKLQALCYKADIEAALRTKGFGGFQLLDLHDFPGQGTALVGVLDPFWEEKGYITPQEYSRFCNSTVPLARMKKHIFTNNEIFETNVEVAHYGEAPIYACTPEWKITGQTGKTIQSGKFAQTDIALGNGIQLGTVSVVLASILTPQKLNLEVTINSFSNSWDFWVYPANKEAIAGEEEIKVVSRLDLSSQQFLEQGGSVLLTLEKGTLTPEYGGNIAIGFSSIFWNTAWTRGQAPHTLGILCNPKHPALADFPTQYHSNWQWWDAMSHSGAINISSMPVEIKPIVRVVDDWFTNRPLALIFEARVGKGKLMVSGIDLTQDLDKRPEAQQLLFSLKKYMTGKNFNPLAELSVQKVKELVAK